MDITPRSWQYVQSNIRLTNDCWIWQGTTKWSSGVLEYGYAHIGGGVYRLAHRVFYEMLVGPIPEGLTLDHLCRNTLCVNPEHLEPVTHRENVIRGVGPTAVNAAKTHCLKGHQFTSANTYINATSGSRVCRKCQRENWKNWKARQVVSASD